jgi:hypothetical protein
LFTEIECSYCAPTEEIRELNEQIEELENRQKDGVAKTEKMEVQDNKSPFAQLDKR